MDKNVKRMFFAAMLLVLLVGVTAISASEVSDDTTLIEDSNQTVAPTDVATTTTSDNIAETTKTIKKEEKNLKSATKTVEVNNYAELTSTMKNAVNDAENDTYIINLKEGSYSLSSNTKINNGSYSPNIIINANNQTLQGSRINLNDKCNNTINDADIYNMIVVGTQNGKSIANLTLNHVTLNGEIQVANPTCILTLNNSTINGQVHNRGTLIISDDTVFTSTANITYNIGTIITNNTNILYPYYNTFDGGSFKNITIDKDIINTGTLTLKNVTLDSTITNNGKLIISDDVIFTENFVLNGNGEIEINETSKIFPYISTLNGNYTVTDLTIDTDKKNYANLTIINSTIDSKIINNINGYLHLINSTINGEVINYGVIIVNNVTNMDNIKNFGDIFEGSLPENYSPEHTTYIITNDTVELFFDPNNGGQLTGMIKEGNTLDFQGTISGITGLSALVINKPVNIITSTNDGRIENFSSITYTNGASGSNVTGLYTYNTQFYVRNAHNMVFDNISNVVISKGIGWGVGQTSIRENSTNITVKNSYFYTKDNGGSSTFVFGWADNCTLVNSTVEADGNVGNLVYLTTYNVDVPSGVVPNSNNHIINNTIRGPETPAGICWAIVLSGINNIVDGNTINYTGTGITGQWGSGVTGVGENDNETSLVGIYNNKVYNNKIDCGVAFTGVKNTTLINNTIYNGLLAIGENNLVYNNTASNVRIIGSDAIIEGNNFTGTVNITNSSNNLTNNTIITNNTYTIIGNGQNNIITNNYLKANTLYGDESVNLNKETNTIKDNTPRYELIIDTTNFTAGETTTIQASIYFDGEIATDINKGKVTFKVNGKTLKDKSGKVIYTKVINGTAQIENYEIPDSWTKEGTTIEAVYAGSTQCAKLTTEKTNLTVTPKELTLTTEDVTAQTGSTVTLTATLSDNTTNAGKVVFKINGKTVKDANGKVVYAKVVNGQVTVNYTIPENMKTGNYTITAVYTSPNSEKVTSEATLTVA